MFRKVVIPLDGSRLAEEVFDILPRYVSPMEGELVLVQTIEAWQYSFGIDMNGAASFLPYLRSAAKTYLRKVQEQLAGRGYQTEISIALGDPATEILNTADETGADLIAMSTHGRTGIRHWTLGSVAERVVHRSPRPVLLVRQEAEVAKSSVNRILVPLDGSGLAEQVLPAAIAIAKDTGAEIMLLQMLQTLDNWNTRILFESEEDVEELYRKWSISAEEYLHNLALRLQSEGVDAKYHARIGDVATGITDAINEYEVDLVAMSTHGRTGLSLWYLGSVAGKVIRNVSCPVLLMRSTSVDSNDVASGEIEQEVVGEVA